MSEIPRKVPLKSHNSTSSVAKKGPYNTKNRRFSILSNSDNVSSDDSSDSSDSGSGSDYDDHIYLNKPRQQSIAKYDNAVSSGSDDNYSSSSDDENIDFVQLTKQRRMKAMKAVKGLKKQIAQTSSVSASPSGSPMNYEEEPELDDDLVDAVIESEERKMNLDDFDKSFTTTPNNNTADIVDYSDDLNEDLENMNFDFSFDEDEKKSQKSKKEKTNDSKNVIEELKDEDIGEAVESATKLNIKGNNLISDEKIEIDVPKFNEQDVNSDDDYEFDNNDLIQTLLKDNDDLELHNLDNSEDDFDYLIANQHKVDHNAVNNSSQKDITVDSVDNTDDAYLMKEETQAMLDDFEKNPSKNKLLKNRRSSMYFHQGYNNGNDLDDLDLDLLNNFEQFLPKQQAMRRRSSILNQTLLSSDDEISDLDTFKNKKISKRKMKEHRKQNNKNIHTKDIRKMLGISNTDSNFTSNFSSNAIVDSDDDTKLLEYIFEDSESENRSTVDQAYADGNETDEDMTLPKRSSKEIGSKHAKEILSSSKDQFRAPKLGTFITKKPFSIVDGFTTRFLHPLNPNQSMLQKAAAINKPDINQSSNNIALDELINISEFDEDLSGEFDEDSHMGDFFDDSKRIPLTAFRNKTLNNGDINLNNRRFSFTDRAHRKKHHKSSKPKHPSLKASRSMSNTVTWDKNLKDKSLQSRSESQVPLRTDVSGILVPATPISAMGGIADSSTGAALITDPTDIEEVLLIGVESLPPNVEHMFDQPSFDFEISTPHQMSSNRKRKSISRSSKARIRRASMVEASAEGLRQTKNGLFDEQVMDDVEALLIDMGDAEDYEFLFGQE